MTQILFAPLKFFHDPFSDRVTARYKSRDSFIQVFDQLPEVHILDLINGNMTIHNPLNEEQFPSIEIKDGDEANSGGSLFL